MEFFDRWSIQKNHEHGIHLDAEQEEDNLKGRVLQRKLEMEVQSAKNKVQGNQENNYERALETEVRSEKNEVQVDQDEDDKSGGALNDTHRVADGSIHLQPGGNNGDAKCEEANFPKSSSAVPSELLHHISNCSETVEISNFIEFVSRLVLSGYRYTIHFCRQMKNVKN